MRSRSLIGLACAALLVLVVSTTPRHEAAAAQADGPVVLAHYYIWYTASSWNRAKDDIPAAGRYSSDQASVMREHVRSAKAAGIDGFIVSWKSTEVLDPRLEALMAIASEEDFKLAITYQGLDFNRDPLPPARVGADLDLFIERYADDPVFDIFGKPLVAWSGTWEYSSDEVASVTSARRERLLVLATEKNVDGIRRLDGLVDGDLYYWASVNPATYPDYPGKLADMSAEVHSQGGYWIAPVAPGFDARNIGGSSAVERADGAVFRTQWDGALASAPDAIGIISWNEFSENTHIEPSQRLGNRYLQVVADLLGKPAPAPVEVDSSSPDGVASDGSGIALRLGLLASLVGTVVGGSAVAIRRNAPQHLRRRRRRQAPVPPRFR